VTGDVPPDWSRSPVGRGETVQSHRRGTAGRLRRPDGRYLAAQQHDGRPSLRTGRPHRGHRGDSAGPRRPAVGRRRRLPPRCTRRRVPLSRRHPDLRRRRRSQIPVRGLHPERPARPRERRGGRATLLSVHDCRFRPAGPPRPRRLRRVHVHAPLRRRRGPKLRRRPAVELPAQQGTLAHAGRARRHRSRRRQRRRGNRGPRLWPPAPAGGRPVRRRGRHRPHLPVLACRHRRRVRTAARRGG